MTSFSQLLEGIAFAVVGILLYLTLQDPGNPINFNHAFSNKSFQVSHFLFLLFAFCFFLNLFYFLKFFCKKDCRNCTYPLSCDVSSSYFSDWGVNCSHELKSGRDLFREAIWCKWFRSYVYGRGPDLVVLLVVLSSGWMLSFGSHDFFPIKVCRQGEIDLTQSFWDLIFLLTGSRNPRNPLMSSEVLFDQLSILKKKKHCNFVQLQKVNLIMTETQKSIVWDKKIVS